MTQHKVTRLIFNVDRLKLVGYLYSPEKILKPPGVLFIHGANKTTNKNIFASWQEYLCQNGYSSFAFFSRGITESEGRFENSTLLNREKDSLKALETYLKSGHVDQNKIAVLGNSMGGHIAAKLTKNRHIKAIILYAAAAYGSEAEDKKLNETFSEAIRKPNNWEDSPAFTSLSETNKPLLVIYPQLDTVIPEGVKAGYKALIKDPQNYIDIPDTTHQSISEHTEKNKKLMKNAFQHSVRFLNEVID